MAKYELGVIGAGNMAEAILRGVIGAGFVQPWAIVACDPDESRRRILGESLGVVCDSDNGVAARQSHVLLAVKPQVLANVLGGVAELIDPSTTVISIAAGVTTSKLDEYLGGRGRIVRVMPNTPLLVGAGISAVAPGPRAGDEELDWTRRMLAASGLVVNVDEDMMDAVTAVSGSGPAYFFYLVEAMTAAGVAEGLDSELALTLARQTALGAGKMMVETALEPAELRRRVTSPGGTTQRAIETMEADGVAESLVRAVRAAAERSRQLGGPARPAQAGG